MSNITTDFITATKKIHADVRAILAALHLIVNDVKAIHEQHSAGNDHAKTDEKHQVIRVPRSMKDQVGAYDAKQYALDKLRFRMEKNAFCVGTCTLVIIAIYTGLTAYQSHQSKRSADAAETAAHAAKSASETTASELELAERPWVDAITTVDGSFSFDINGANVPLKLTLRNTGHSPAVRVGIWPVMFFGANIANASAFRDKACEDAPKMQSMGITLFPSAAPFEQQYTVSLSKEEIEKGKASNQFPGSKFGEVILSPTVAVCIAYRSTYDQLRIYRTAYIMDLFKLEPSGLSANFKIGENVDRRHLFLRMHFQDAIAAD